jgi:hypothetical protein
MSEGSSRLRLLQPRRKRVEDKPRLVRIAKRALRRAASRKVKMQTRPQVKAIRVRAEAKCGICLGMIKRDLPSVICACGDRFHNTCAIRTGTCPNCGKQLWYSRQKPHVVDSEASSVKPMRLSKEDKLFLLEERFLLGELTARTYLEMRDEVRGAPETAHFCEACGRRLADGEDCDCTAGQRESQCPECGSRLSDEDMFCRVCGVVFVDDFSEDLFQCPECERIVSEKESTCECGALLVGEGNMICPGCGAEIPENSSECPICGHAFVEEISECPACGRRVDRDAFLCECGVVFSDRVAGAECSECGTVVGLEDVFCPQCGARFADSPSLEGKLEREIRS